MVIHVANNKWQNAAKMWTLHFCDWVNIEIENHVVNSV